MAIQDVFCDKLKGEFDKISNPLEGLNKAESKARGIESKINKIKKTIMKTTLSPLGDISNGINNINTDLGGMIPASGEMEELISLMSSCDYFNGDASNPVDMISKASGILNSVQNDVVNAVSGMADTLGDTIPEFKIGNMFDEISVDFDTGGVALDMSNLDKIINCITEICGPTYISEASDMIDRANEIYSKMNMIDDPNDVNFGKLDIDSICSDAGLSQDQIEGSIKSVTDTLTNSKETVSNSIIDGASEMVGLFI